MPTCINNPHVLQTKKKFRPSTADAPLPARIWSCDTPFAPRRQAPQMIQKRVMGWFAQKDGENQGDFLAAENGEDVALDEQVWKLGMLAGIMSILVMKTSDFTNNLPIKMVKICILTTEILKLCHLINKNVDVPLLNQWITTAHLRYPAKTLRFPHLLFPHGKKTYQAGFLDVFSFHTYFNKQKITPRIHLPLTHLGHLRCSTKVRSSRAALCRDSERSGGGSMDFTVKKNSGWNTFWQRSSQKMVIYPLVI